MQRREVSVAVDASLSPEPPPAAWWRSIGAKLLLGSGALLVASNVLFGYVAFGMARSAMLPSIREQLADDAMNVKGGLEEMLKAHYLNVRTWAHLPMMHGIADSKDRNESASRFLESVQHDYGDYLAVVALDRAGVGIAASDAGLRGRSLAGTPIASPTGPGAFDGEPTLEWSQEYRAPFLRLAAAIPDGADPSKTAGTLVALLDREVLDRIVVPKPGHSHIELRLFDRNDRLIAGNETPLEIRHFGDLRIEGSERATVRDGSPPLVREGRDADGRSFILAEVSIGGRHAIPTRGWRLVASVPREFALAPVTAARDWVLAVGVALVALGLLATAWLANRLAQPINELTRVATRIARSGDLESVPSPRSRDEVGQLARAFQRMVAAVAAANDNMIRTSKLAFLGEMAAGMAHEVRTPLGIIRSSAQLIERRALAAGDAEAGEWAVFIREEADRLAKVVTELLEFVKPVPPRKVDVDLTAVARRATSLLSTEAATRKVRVTVIDPPFPVIVSCDPDQILQICLNLLMNALQASPRGSEVTVATESRGTTAALLVRDRGPGIPPALLARLFEPFTSQRDGGIGLGLAVVRRIARAHDGEVTARNRAGGGAKFAVLLPALRPATEDHHAH